MRLRARPLLLAVALTGASAAHAACDLLWQITPQLDSTPRSLQVSLRFDPGNRSNTVLRLPAGWQGITPLPDSPAQSPVADEPTLRSVQHPPGQPVTLRWQLRPGPADAAVRLGAQWLALAGQAVLPVPEDSTGAAPAAAASTAQSLCVSIDGLPEGSRFVGSTGSGQGSAADRRQTWQFSGAASQVQLAWYAGGALHPLARQAEGQAVQVLVPADAGLALTEAALADDIAAGVAGQRRFWRDAATDAPALPVLVIPGPPRSAPEGTALGAALLLQVPGDLSLPSTPLQTALTEALLRQRLPERLGPLVHAGRRDEALRAWLGEGLVAFYSHRLLLRAGLWTPEDYAAELNRRIERYLASPVLAADNLKVATGWMSDPALAELPGLRGEWLALQWHAALRAAGQPGLDGVLRKLMLPAAQARREGPLSSPLATHRLLAALRHTLDDAPLRELTDTIDRGVPFVFRPDTLGPCFKLGSSRQAEWRLGFDRNALATGVANGVEPGGPAEAAGLRDGMAIRGYRVVHGDVSQPVWLQVQDSDGSLRTLSYTAAGPRERELPRYTPVAQALQQPACQGWLGQGPSAEREAEIASAKKSKRGAAASAATGKRKGGKAAASGAKGKAGGKAANKSSTKPGGKAAGKASATKGAAKAGKASATKSRKPA